MASLSRLSPPVLVVLLVAVGSVLGWGAWLATREPPVEELSGDVAVASKGDAFDLKESLVPGKYTIFDFYADWCAPCRALDPQLRRLAHTRADVAVRKVDIIDWTTPVVRQFEITDLPYMRVYDPNGALLGAGDEAYRVIATVLGTEIL